MVWIGHGKPTACGIDSVGVGLNCSGQPVRGSCVQPLERLVEADRVHRSVYTDQEIFDREMENIWEKTWVYCGHESQVKKAGDYVTVQIGRQPMIMVRGMDGNIRVLFNRCPCRAP